MCVHYWIIDSHNKGICRKCDKEKDFSPYPIKLTADEKREIKYSFNHVFYRQGGVCLERLNVR